MVFVKVVGEADKTDKMDKADKACRYVDRRRSRIKSFFTAKTQRFSQSSQRINHSKPEHCVPCENPLRTLR